MVGHRRTLPVGRRRVPRVRAALSAIARVGNRRAAAAALYAIGARRPFAAHRGARSAGAPLGHGVALADACGSLFVGTGARLIRRAPRVIALTATRNEDWVLGLSLRVSLSYCDAVVIT